MSVSDKQLKIFSRQLILKDFGEKFFKKTDKKEITIIGLGGIGCPAVLYLVTTGFNKITLVDDDKVKLENLNRQILFNTNSINKKKVEVAKKKLRLINPKCEINIIPKRIDKINIKRILKNSALVLDSTDNWKSMMLINEYCVKNFIPLVSSSVLGCDGQVVLFQNNRNDHLCLNCIYPNKKEPDLPRCENVGILGTAAGLTGIIVAQTIINFFSQNIKNMDKIIMINTKLMKIEYIKVKKNANCIYIK